MVNWGGIWSDQAILTVAGSAEGAIGLVEGWTCRDADAFRNVDIYDPVYLISYALVGGPATNPPLSGAPICDGMAHISDAISLIGHVFGGSPARCAGY